MDNLVFGELYGVAFAPDHPKGAVGEETPKISRPDPGFVKVNALGLLGIVDVLLEHIWAPNANLSPRVRLIRGKAAEFGDIG